MFGASDFNLNLDIGDISLIESTDKITACRLMKEVEALGIWDSFKAEDDRFDKDSRITYLLKLIFSERGV